MKYTRNFLKKIESIFEELSYSVLYGKGNFQSSSCIIEQEKKVVVNEFYGIQGKVEALTEILLSIDIDHDKLSAASKYTLKKLHRHYENTRKNEG